MVARLVYGFRISVLFRSGPDHCLVLHRRRGGSGAGLLRRLDGPPVPALHEIWTAIPTLYLILIVSSVLIPGFWTLFTILLAFSWVALVGVVRAEFLRARNFEYVTAARALGRGQRHHHAPAPACQTPWSPH